MNIKTLTEEREGARKRGGGGYTSGIAHFEVSWIEKETERDQRESSKMEEKNEQLSSRQVAKMAKRRSGNLP